MTSARQRSGFAAFVASLPRGGALSEPVWSARHRGILALLWAHVVALAIIATVRGEPLVICVLVAGVVAAFAIAAMWGRLGRNTQATMATLGLLSSSAILIVLFDGLIEAHFHFFIIIAVVALYQSWQPYLVAVAFVLVHHLVLGTLVPRHVYNHSAAIDSPWLFALIHGGAVLAESVACLLFWKVSEEARDAERTHRKALERTNSDLMTANTAVSDLVAMLSHDLRTPLTVLIGRSEMALESWPTMSRAEQIDFVRKVNSASQSLHKMLDDTLAVSVLDGDGLDPRPAPVRVDEAVRETLVSLPGPLLDADLRGLQAATAVVDRGHLDQVLTNLLTNAVKYGGGHFAATTAADHLHVAVRISDAGGGVPASFVPHLFDRFSRSDEARNGSQKGTGLGLYISRSLMVANGGDITYEPTPGGGATFCLQLPRGAAS